MVGLGVIQGQEHEKGGGRRDISYSTNETCSEEIIFLSYTVLFIPVI